MKIVKPLPFVFLICLSSHPVFGQDMSFSKDGKNYYSEMANPARTDYREWDKAENTVNVSFGSDNLRYAKEKVPVAELTKSWNATAWKGEKIHTQILVWTKKDISSLGTKINGLKNEKDQIIDAKNIKASFVRYVMTDEFGKGCGTRKTTDYDSSLVEDPFDIIDHIPVLANTVQPIWLSIRVPVDAAAGKYTGMVTVIADKEYTLGISLNILNHRLPPPAEWKFDLDLWQSAYSISAVHDVPLWSAEHFRIMKPYFTMLADAGQKIITVNIINQPWGVGHIFYKDPTLISRIKKKDGTWSFDYSVFDKYVTFMMECGINQRINCYSMVTWDLKFLYFDEASGKEASIKAEPGSKEYNDYWTTMLSDFTKHLKLKGWFNKTAIAMDERSMESMKAVIALLKRIDPKWKTALAGDYHPEIEKDIYDYCIIIRHKFPENVLNERKASGKPTTYYTACGEEYPNSFSYSPPAENTWIGWYASAGGFTGYLRWAYNNWTENTLQDTRFRTWPAGDCYQIYPGPRSSIRFEKLIEGIQDFEKIRILQEQLRKEGNLNGLKELSDVLATFQVEKLKDTPAAEMLLKAKTILNKF
jgi:hypothetical protein